MNEILDDSSLLDGKRHDIPGTGSSLAMGIISIVLAGLIGLILGIITLNRTSDVVKDVASRPNYYTEKTISQNRSARVCAIIGTSISALWILVSILLVVFNL